MKKYYTLIYFICIYLFVDIVVGTVYVNLILDENKPDPQSAFRVSNSRYHHDLLPNVKGIKYKWGPSVCNMYTNALGFKDRKVREIKCHTSKKRILFIGDSFTEGIGLDYDKTFVGMVDNYYRKRNVEILNAGVVSYSPLIYLKKVKYLIDSKRLKFNSLYVFLDASDIQDELVYFNETVRYNDEIGNKELKPKFKFVSISVRLFFILRKKYLEYIKKGNQIIDKQDFQYNREKWMSNDLIYNNWGHVGVYLAKKNLIKLKKICDSNHIEMSLFVYPWPFHIQENKVRDRHVKIWEEFCKVNDIRFNSYYQLFINDKKKPQEIISKYFIKADCHYNENGNKIIANSLISLINRDTILWKN